jgi:hypothetical protein
LKLENRKLNCKLEENKELKLIILAEAPWISDAMRSRQNQTSLIICFRKMKSVQEATLTNKQNKKKALEKV